MGTNKIILDVGLLMVLLTSLSCGQQFTSPEKKNFLFIAIDDLRPILKTYDNQTIHAPHIDQLAQNGMAFTRAYCQVAVCNPSRASILTGLRPDQLQVWTNKPHFREHTPEVVTLPQFFKQQGYASREIGKIFHDPASHKDPPSWTGPSYYEVTQNGKGHKYVLPENYTPKRTKAAAVESAEVADTAYIDGKVSQAAIAVLREVKDSSFFLAVGFRRPHLPFSAPKKYWDLYSREQFRKAYKGLAPPTGAPDLAFHNANELRGYEGIPKEDTIVNEQQWELLHGYFASISYVDAQVGKLLKELETLGLSENTLIVLWSDHGFHIGDFGLWCKATNFEAATRVPLIFSGPGIAKGQINASIVELIDLYPTLVEWAGFQASPTLAGKSLSAQLTQPIAKDNDPALSQFVRPYSAINSRSPTIMGYSLRTNQYRYTEWRSFPDMAVIDQELYDIGHDGVERINLAVDKKHVELMLKLSAQIDRMRQ